MSYNRFEIVPPKIATGTSGSSSKIGAALAEYVPPEGGGNGGTNPISCVGASSKIRISPIPAYNSNGSTVEYTVKINAGNNPITLTGVNSQYNFQRAIEDNPYLASVLKVSEYTEEDYIEIEAKPNVGNVRIYISPNINPEQILKDLLGNPTFDQKLLTGEVNVCLREGQPDDDHEVEVGSFDYAVVRYIWDSAGGKDLDTRTYITSPARNVKVGWSRQSSDTNSSGHNYLTWGGDNTGIGVECVLLDMKELIQDYPSVADIHVYLDSFWYSQRNSGNFEVQFQTFKGGTMQQSGYDFINVGGQIVATQTISVNATTQQSSNIEGDRIALLKYNTQTETGTLTAVNPGSVSKASPTLKLLSAAEQASVMNSIFATNGPVSIADSPVEYSKFARLINGTGGSTDPAHLYSVSDLQGGLKLTWYTSIPESNVSGSVMTLPAEKVIPLVFELVGANDTTFNIIKTDTVNLLFRIQDNFGLNVWGGTSPMNIPSSWSAVLRAQSLFKLAENKYYFVYPINKIPKKSLVDSSLMLTLDVDGPATGYNPSIIGWGLLGDYTTISAPTSIASPTLEFIPNQSFLLDKLFSAEMNLPAIAGISLYKFARLSDTSLTVDPEVPRYTISSASANKLKIKLNSLINPADETSGKIYVPNNSFIPLAFKLKGDPQAIEALYNKMVSDGSDFAFKVGDPDYLTSASTGTVLVQNSSSSYRQQMVFKIEGSVYFVLVINSLNPKGSLASLNPIIDVDGTGTAYSQTVSSTLSIESDYDLQVAPITRDSAKPDFYYAVYFNSYVSMDVKSTIEASATVTMDQEVKSLSSFFSTPNDIILTRNVPLLNVPFQGTITPPVNPNKNYNFLAILSFTNLSNLREPEFIIDMSANNDLDLVLVPVIQDSTGKVYGALEVVAGSNNTKLHGYLSKQVEGFIAASGGKATYAVAYYMGTLSDYSDTTNWDVKNVNTQESTDYTDIDDLVVTPKGGVYVTSDSPSIRDDLAPLFDLTPDQMNEETGWSIALYTVYNDNAYDVILTPTSVNTSRKRILVLSNYS